NVRLGAPIHQIEAGGDSSCAVSMSGGIKCWGDNRFGQLGYMLGPDNHLGSQPGDMPPSDVRVGSSVEQVTMGLWHVCVLLHVGDVKCWGDNRAGQLGIGSTHQIGADAGDMPPATVNLGAMVTMVSAGDYHTCALTKNTGKMLCWGGNRQSQTGLMHNETDSSTWAVGDEPGEMPPAEADVGPERIEQLSAGGNHTCAIMQTLRDGLTLRCFGLNDFGQLGYGHVDTLGDDPGEMPPANIDFDYKPVFSVLCSRYKTCAIVNGGLIDGYMVCWGLAAYHQLGDGYTWGFIGIGPYPEELFLKSPKQSRTVDLGVGIVPMEIASGMLFTCTITHPDHAVKCFGRNNRGQLGYLGIDEFGWEKDMPPPPVPMDSDGGGIDGASLLTRNTLSCTPTSYALRPPGRKLAGGYFP
ncbi:hypothetical protein CYMTET_49846, partial [Cymbomonas tetramitiformis]